MGDAEKPANTSLSTELLVSVVVPTYNVEEYIDQCLDSIENQTYSRLEIILVDDGSTDDTCERLDAHAKKDSRIQILTQKNSYAGVARNNGFDHAKGDYIIFLDADDYFEPSMIETMLQTAQETDADVVLCRSNYYDVETGETTLISRIMEDIEFDPVRSGESLGDTFFQKCVGWAWDKFYRMDFIKETGLRFQDFRTTNDAYFGFMSVILAERIAFVDEPMVQHRINNPHSLEGTRNKSWDNALKAASTVKESLVEHGLYECFERSYLNWILDFFMWNFETLDDEAREGLIQQMRKDFVGLLPDNPRDDYYFHEREAIAAKILQADDTGAVKEGLLLDIDLVRLKNDEKWLRDTIDQSDKLIRERDDIIRGRDEILRERDETIIQRDATIEQLNEDIARHENTIHERDELIGDRDATIEQLQRDLSAKTEEVQRLEDDKQDVLNSTTYKVGKAITAAPRAVKKSLSKE